MSRHGAGTLASLWLAFASTGAHADAAIPVFVAQGEQQVAFAPWDDVEGLIVKVIRGAETQVLVHAYLLTSKKIATTLIAARRRGIDVQVLVDSEQVAKTPLATEMLHEMDRAGIPVWLETKYQNAHNKVIVTDPATSKATVVTGSYNFTWTAQHRNAENILVSRRNPALASRYTSNWERHRREAVLYKK
ncbi:MAG TPA: phospholipase D-like domain-containing protein [Noviherbaspirillum sp.]|jgi:phosphatidylserine/phosphatidylglycerophosphate/cardiolipin synthase-like enzyme|uniref:phospholipase D-like domain-containing protein n=1 Tax=Noviherbaspirillum sp. TaxID=1926288 RepID=UPI002DDCE245|nr:phospholipase D-like domain-containing protein [Noviherbaspirillum sp.]HEV2612679.1 phospholipase D-like domain-containing protein [Noviherbaspirillum sp.]